MCSFLKNEAADGVALIVAAAMALVWASSPWQRSYVELWRTGADARTRGRGPALPAFAALGGMVVPAAIYLAINAGGEGAHGWGIPMATDSAFAVGVLTLLGSRLSRIGARLSSAAWHRLGNRSSFGLR